MANKEYRPLRQRLRVETADSKLLFVGFALLIMVIGPIITGALININEQELLVSVDRAEQQVQALRSASQSGSRSTSAIAPVQPGAMGAAFDNALREQEHAKATINALHDIQDCVIAVFGLLGLVAAFYSRRALQDTRATLRELDAERAKLAVAFDTTREGERRFRELSETDARRARALESLFETAGHLSVSASPRETRQYLTHHVARVLQASRVVLWSYDSARCLLSPLLPSWGFADAQLASAAVAVAPGEWTHDLLFLNATIRSSDVASESDGALYEQLRAWNVGSVLAVPLIAHGQPVGILCACDKQEETSAVTAPARENTPGQDTSTQDSGQDISTQEAGQKKPVAAEAAKSTRIAFTDEDVRVLRTFAGQAAFVLHSAQQYANARARSEELAALARLTRVLVNSLELEAIVPAFLGEVRALIPYGRARIALLPPAVTNDGWSQEYPEYDEDETDLLRRLRGKFTPNSQTAIQLWSVEWPFPDAALPALLPARTQTLPADDRLRRALQNGRNLQRQARGGKGAQPDGVLLFPIIAQERLLGAVEFEEAEPDKDTRFDSQEGKSERFGENHFVLAQQAVDQFAAAVQNAQSFAEATRRAEQLQWAIEETHHRIKNNLQAVISILDLYRMEVEDAGSRHSAMLSASAQKETVAQEGIAHAMREVRTIAAVHELLSEDIHNSRVNMRHMLDSLVPLLLTASVTVGRRVQTDIEADDITLPSKLVSALALAANELIVNAVRHGGAGRGELRLRVELKQVPGEIMLIVSDDGRGFAPGFDPQKNAKIGLGLTRTLIERDFKGKLTFINQDERSGAVVTATVPYSGG